MVEQPSMSSLEAAYRASIFSQPVDVSAFNASQSGEVYGNMPSMTAENFSQHVERNAIDLSRSPRWTVGTSLSGVALLGFRGERVWVGGFGVVPEFRGRGLARRYLQDVLSICRDAGAETLELEVLVRNAAAIALYKRGGFAIVDELVIWSRAPVGANAVHLPVWTRDEREIASVARTPSACWQREPQSVAAASPRERLVIGNDATPQAYAFVRRNLGRTTILDVGACETTSAHLLLDEFDAFAPEAKLTLLNEPAHGPLHQALTARASWTEATRQHKMRLSLTMTT